jgi:hypothetical protein
VGFSFDDEPTVNSKDELNVATSGWLVQTCFSRSAAFLDRAQRPRTYKTGPRHSFSNHPINCQAARGSAHVC